MITRWALTVIIALTLSSQTSWANEIYINQAGDDLTMTVVQDGWANEFQFCATDTSDSNCIDLNGNTPGWSRGHDSDDSTVDVSQTGNENIVRMSHGAGTNNGNSRKSTVVITGDENSVLNRLTNPSSGGNWGGHKETDILITGDGNRVIHDNDSYGEGWADIDVTGDNNVVDVYQRAMDSTATVNVTNAGGPVTATVRQLGSSYQDTSGYSTSVTQYCTNANGCSVTVTQN